MNNNTDWHTVKIELLKDSTKFYCHGICFSPKVLFSNDVTYQSGPITFYGAMASNTIKDLIISKPPEQHKQDA